MGTTNTKLDYWTLHAEKKYMIQKMKTYDTFGPKYINSGPRARRRVRFPPPSSLPFCSRFGGAAVHYLAPMVAPRSHSLTLALSIARSLSRRHTYTHVACLAPVIGLKENGFPLPERRERPSELSW